MQKDICIYIFFICTERDFRNLQLRWRVAFPHRFARLLPNVCEAAYILEQGNHNEHQVVLIMGQATCPVLCVLYEHIITFINKYIYIWLGCTMQFHSRLKPKGRLHKNKRL